MTHPVITLEDEIVKYLKQKIALAALWILNNKPTRSAFRALMFNKPEPGADAQLFTFNGWSFGTRFYGSVRSQAVEVQAPAKPRIVKP